MFLLVLCAGLGVANPNHDVATGVEAGAKYPKYGYDKGYNKGYDKGYGYKDGQDCKQNGWICGKCNKYTGTKTCKPKILVYPSGNGQPCDPSIEKPCDVDCKVSDWKYSGCNKTCGKGYRYGRRDIIIHPKNNGEKCPVLADKKKCFEKPCPVNCLQTDFVCGDCDYNTGFKTCRRKTVIYAAHHGRPCGQSSIKRKCRVDCKVSYENWSQCSKTCGGGYQKRSYQVIYHAKHGGKRCPKLYETKQCNIKPCRVDCEQSDFVCGKCDYHTGYKTCTRKTVVYPAHYGRQCGPSSTKRECRVDCRVSDYGSWSKCDKKCGGGYQKRTRTVIYHPKHGGKYCPALYDIQQCNTKPCSRDCEQSDWHCGECDYTTGYKECHRRVLRYPLGHGKKCGRNWKRIPCKVDCKVSAFYGYFGRCSKKCGGGYQKRFRTIIYHPKNGGEKCPKLYEKQKCNTQPCSVDCEQTDFECGECDYKTGYKKCKRTTLIYPKGYGKKCGPSYKTEDCDVNCKVSTGYGYWEKCSKQCGGGWKKRCRTIFYHAKNNGKKCPSAEALCEKEKCNTHSCGKYGGKYGGNGGYYEKGKKYLGGHHYTIVGVCGFILLGGAIKMLRKKNNGGDSYEELAGSEECAELI